MNAKELNEQTDMRYWFPWIKKLGINIPKTYFVDADYNDLLKMLDGNLPKSLAPLLENLKKAVKKVGEPFFMRTAFLSGKHAWADTCYCESFDSIGRNISGLVEATALAWTVPFGCLVVREFLPLRAGFKAFNNMPIAREFRFFVKDGEVIHWQPYWPPNSMRNTTIDNWEELLHGYSQLDYESLGYLTYTAKEAGKKLGGFWSVDFAQHIDQNWYLIDMARGEESFYWNVDRPAEDGKCGLDLLEDLKDG